MSSLKRQIKQLEGKIIAKDKVLRKQFYLLHRKISLNKIISLTMIVSFIYGFLLARKKSIKQSILALIKTTFKINQLYKSFIYE